MSCLHQQEVEVLHLVSDHPNIALLVGAFEDKSHVHLVLEICNGGELFDRIVSKGNLSERQAAEYFRTMVQVAAHCHQLGMSPFYSTCCVACFGCMSVCFGCM
jgi:calcium-dependent protein kinase